MAKQIKKSKQELGLVKSKIFSESGWEIPLKSLMGPKGIETLNKAIHRRDSDSTIGPLDVYLPLLVVPRAILSWLIQNIKPIPIGETRKLQLEGMDGIEISIEKQGIDAYKGDLIRDGKIIHSFEKQTLPNVGGNLLSIGEMYESFTETEMQAQPDLIGPDLSMPLTMMRLMAPKTDYSRVKEIDAASISNLTCSVGKLVDALVSNNLAEQKINAAIASIKTSKGTEPEPPPDTIEPEIRVILNNDKGIKKTAQQESPGGQSKPAKPQGLVEPEKPNRLPVSEKSYFRKKLQRTKGIEKKENSKTYHIQEHELYTDCPHCGVPEFKKTEKGPKYTPCACFYITLKNEDGTPNFFVRVIKKSEGGYALTFDENTDKETIQTFLSTLKNKLISYKDSLD